MPDNLELISPMPNDDLPNIGVAGEFFAGFMEFLKASLLTNGIDETHARDFVIKVVYELSQAFAGDTFYVTKKPVVFARQMAMYADLQTMPHYDVDKKYGVSRGYSLKVAQQIDAQRKHREQLKPSI